MFLEQEIMNMQLMMSLETIKIVIIFMELNQGLHTVYVKDKNGCGIVSEMITSVKAPKFFTPNHDGVYDAWLPVGFSRDLHSDVSIYVFDRYGKLLAELDPYGEGWNI